MDMTSEIIPGLILRDLFMISPSHWTATEKSLANIAPFSPSALTLKTTSVLRGGSGNADIGRRRKSTLEDSRGNRFATYTDGPATLELLDCAATYSLTCSAQRLLPSTKIGLSVLQGESYETIARILRPENYSYVELNLKYSLREVQLATLQDFLNDLKRDIELFLEAFGSLPVLIKLPREATALLSLADFQEVFSVISQAQGAVIIANSLKTVVPPSRSSLPTLSELKDGVIVGEHLFLNTYNAIRALTKNKQAGHTIPPIVASGGVVDIGGVMDVLAAGASAVQLCTALDIWGPFVLPLLRDQLRTIGNEYDSLTEFMQKLCQEATVWEKAARIARELRVNEKVSVERIFEDDESVLQHLKNALIEECKDQEKSLVPDEEVQVPEDLRFVVSKGNISTFLLGNLVVEQCNLRPLHFDSAADFCSQLTEPDFHWDFAILPDSTLRYLGKQKGHVLDDCLPIKIADVAKSSIHLMGIHGLSLSDLRGVYHFRGNSARFALSRLLKECQPSTDDLIGPQLLPLLRCWDERKAILAKLPLASFYGGLCRNRVQKKWSTIWSVSEPLTFVASKSLLNGKNGPRIAESVLACLVIQRQSVLQNPERAAKRLRNEGFLTYCRRMLLGNPMRRML